MKNFTNLALALESLKNLHFNELFFFKVYNVCAEKYRGVIFHNTEGWCKIWRKTDLWFGKWHEKFGKFSPEHLKVSKLGLWWDPFVQSRKGMTLKFTEELCVMTMKNNAKFEEELTCSKLAWRIWRILIRALKNLKNLHFNGLLLIKGYNVWAKKVHRGYVSWQWRLMQNLKENWLCFPNWH